MGDFSEDRLTLIDLMSGLCARDGSVETPIPGLFLTRSSTTAMPRTTLDRAIFCVVLGGAKSVLLNREWVRYSAGEYLLISLDLPLVSQIEQASPGEPMLCLSLVLDFEEIGTLIAEMKLEPTGPVGEQRSLTVNRLEGGLLDSVIRLLQLLHHPEDLPLLAPLVKREIYIRLLRADKDGILRRMAVVNGKVQGIAAGLKWLRKNAVRQIRMKDLAREMHMSPSSMHAWFRAVTSMSPLQFQKQMRLHKARQLMFAESLDAASASRRVGYESASQFSREYRRFFGAPPLKDVERLRGAGGARPHGLEAERELLPA